MAGAISLVWPISAHPIDSTCAACFRERQVSPETRMDSSLSRVRRYARDRGGHHWNRHAQRSDERREDDRNLSPTLRLSVCRCGCAR